MIVPRTVRHRSTEFQATRFPIFLSVVLVLRNQSKSIEVLLGQTTTLLCDLVDDYELVVIDNASDDDSTAVLKRLTGENGLPNLQVYALTKEVDSDIACWAGLENALGDFVAVVDPHTDDVGFLPEMLNHALRGADVVFAANEQKSPQSIPYRVCSAVFNAVYKWFNGFHLVKEAPKYRVLSRTVVNFVMQHSRPAVTYRHLPASSGFARVTLCYSAPPKASARKRLSDGIGRGMQMLVSNTRGPMRIVTALSLFGAVANLLYSIYVIAIFMVKDDVAPGWVTLSLQQSGMFLLISLVLLVLGEYILHMATLSNEGPAYHVAQEFTSSIMSRRHKLNIEEARRRPAA
jgi:polyisoprenyl-phosphate glycosyltransferase